MEWDFVYDIVGDKKDKFSLAPNAGHKISKGLNYCAAGVSVRTKSQPIKKANKSFGIPPRCGNSKLTIRYDEKKDKLYITGK